MINSADPDQLASSEANWSGSTLFAKTGHDVFSKRRVKIQMRWLKTSHLIRIYTFSYSGLRSLFGMVVLSKYNQSTVSTGGLIISDGAERGIETVLFNINFL